MSDRWLVLINSIIGLLGALLGFGASFLEQRWRLKQSRQSDEWKQQQIRIDALLEPRRKVYSEGLQLVYDVEQNQTDPVGLKKILDRWANWYPQNAIDLPPSVNGALFSAMNWTHAVYVNLSNKDYDTETWRIFKEKLQSAKELLMKQAEIAWLPDDLKRA